MAKTNAQKQQEFKERKLAAGYVIFKAWVKPEHKQPVRDFIKKLETNG